MHPNHSIREHLVLITEISSPRRHAFLTSSSSSPAHLIPFPDSNQQVRELRWSSATMLVIKASLGTDIRRLSLPSQSYPALITTLSAIFPATFPACAVKYSDEDGDAITIASDADLAEAARDSGDRVLRLTLVPAPVSQSGGGDQAHVSHHHSHARQPSAQAAQTVQPQPAQAAVQAQSQSVLLDPVSPLPELESFISALAVPESYLPAVAVLIGLTTLMTGPGVWLLLCTFGLFWKIRAAPPQAQSTNLSPTPAFPELESLVGALGGREKFLQTAMSMLALIMLFSGRGVCALMMAGFAGCRRWKRRHVRRH